MDNEIDFSMLDLFRIELENNTKVLETGLVQVEQDLSPEKIEPLMRAAHSIKGAARVVGLNSIVSLAHAMEDVLSAGQRGAYPLTSNHIDLLLQGNDALLRLSTLDASAISEWLERESKALTSLSESLLALHSSGGPETGPDPGSGQRHRKTAAPLVETKPRKEEEDAPKGRPPEKEEMGFVRVVSDSLNRLMGYAGECLVQAKSAKPFVGSLLKMKEEYMELVSGLEQVHGFMKNPSFPQEIQERFGEYLGKLDDMRDFLVTRIADFELFSRSLERLADKLYEEVVAIRMRPFSDGVPGFPRMVRDLAKSMGKKVEFSISGESTRVDRDVLEKLEAPLTHLLRNAIDHGLETPEERLAAGKPATGALILEARHAAGMLTVRVADDGRGVDAERLRQKVVEGGHVSAEIAAELSESELLDFLFLPGFSTAGEVTEVSGRGVGLDVVLSMVQGVGGAVRVETKPGLGTSFNLQLPLTLSVLRALLVEIGGQPYAIPLSRIERIVECDSGCLKVLEDKQFYAYENENVGVVDGRQVLRVPASNGSGGTCCIVIVGDRLNRFGLVVEKFLGRHELVVVPLDKRLGRIPNVSAGAILDDGSPVLILDVDDLVRSIDNLLTHGRLFKVGERKTAAAAPDSRKRILVIDDSLTVREVERRLLENIGYEVAVAVDGVEAWNSIQFNRFDLVVSDIDMPRMNGIELIRKIKGHPNLKETPVIIVSYKDREQDRLLGLEAGADYYLTKSSFQDQGLTNAVRDLIGRP